MDLYTMPRRGGKTTTMVRLSAEKNIPMLVGNKMQFRTLEDVAREIGVEIPQPICVVDILNNKYRESVGDILIDELPYVLKCLTGKNIVAATFTPND